MEELWKKVGIAVLVLVIIVILLVGAYFIYQNWRASSQAAAEHPFLHYGVKEGATLPPEEAADEDGIPKMIEVAPGVHCLAYGPELIGWQSLLETIRRACLIPEDLGRRPNADPKQMVLKHPKKYASQFEQKVPEAEQKMIRNALLSVFIERCIVQSAQTQVYAEAISSVSAPLSVESSALSELLAQLQRKPFDAGQTAKCLNDTLNASDRRIRFIAITAVFLLVFTRDSAPIGQKVLEVLKQLDFDAVLSAADVEPLAMWVFERMVQVRTVLGKPAPSSAELAEDAVRRGKAFAVTAALLSPRSYPPPSRPVPSQVLPELLLATLCELVRAIAQHVVKSAAEDPVQTPFFNAMLADLVRLGGFDLPGVRIHEGPRDALTDAERAAIEEAVRRVQEEKAKHVVPEVTEEHSTYPGGFGGTEQVAAVAAEERPVGEQPHDGEDQV